MPNARGDGVFFEDLGRGRWKIRWRERKPGGGYRNRSTTMGGTDLDRDNVMMEIRNALSARGTYEPDALPVAPEPVRPCSILDLMLACIDARVALGKYKGKTQHTYTSYALRVADNLHRLLSVPASDPLPAHVLDRELFVRLQQLDIDRGASNMMRYASLRFLLDAWGWAHDANVEAAEHGKPLPWPGVPSAPRRTKDYLPRTPTYGRTIAPSMPHIDAVVRRIWTRPKVNAGTKIAALFLRYTGLRSEQVFGIMRDDVDVTARTLYVRTGKTEMEKADARTVPLSARLFEEPGVRGWLETTHSGEPLFPKRRHAWTLDRENGRTKQPSELFKAAWQDATDAGEVPKHVWAPPNRKIARPEHSFRAAFQAFLEEERVPGNVIDFLVGHEDGSVRDLHYGRELLDGARQAVDKIPAVVWVKSEELPENVVLMPASG